MNNYISRSVESTCRMVRFTNADRKSWIVPIDGMRIALSLYQPSGAQGKLLKLLLPYLYWFSPMRRIIKAESMQVGLNPHIKVMLHNVLNIDSFEFSIFEGTPSVHQKVTIQISQGDEIVAYCKLSEDLDVVSLFWKEQIILAELHRRGVANIPICYFCGRVEAMSDTTIFIQSTIKSSRSKVIHKWGEHHERFIEELHQKTKVLIEFDTSDFARSLVVLESYLDIFSSSSRAAVERAIAIVRGYYTDSSVIFSALHGDFTPWNVFFERGELFVFDFEYAGLTYPPYLDRYHFTTQSAIYERHLTVDQIYSEFVGAGFSKMEYTSYLLDVISKYLHRENGAVVAASHSNINIWIDLINRLW